MRFGVLQPGPHYDPRQRHQHRGRYVPYCSSLTSIYFTGNAPAADSTVFDSNSNATAYYMPGATGWNSRFAGLPALLWNPVMQTGDGRFGVKGNHFGFDIAGTPNIPIMVEASTSLANPFGRRWPP